MNKQFSSKYNIGQSVAESINLELNIAKGFLEGGLFNKSFIKYNGIKDSIPSKKIKTTSKKNFNVLEKLYFKAHKKKDNPLKYKIIIKYRESIINELDANSMYLPSLKDTSNFT